MNKGFTEENRLQVTGRFFLFCSTYCPLFLIVGFSLFLQGYILGGSNSLFLLPGMIFILLGGGSIAFILLQMTVLDCRVENGQYYQVSNVYRPRDQRIEYILTWIVPILLAHLDKVYIPGLCLYFLILYVFLEEDFLVAANVLILLTHGVYVVHLSQDENFAGIKILICRDRDLNEGDLIKCYSCGHLLGYGYIDRQEKNEDPPKVEDQD